MNTNNTNYEQTINNCSVFCPIFLSVIIIIFCLYIIFVCLHLRKHESR